LATVEECEKALHELAAQLADRDPADAKTTLERTISCHIRDLDVTWSGRLTEGRLDDIQQVGAPEAQVKLSMKSDDLLKLVAGQLNMAAAWATGRVKVDASVRDVMRLRSIF
jgi:predicted lipid carrier protein YhbT